MYFFKIAKIEEIDTSDYYSNPDKVPFVHLEWVRFLETMNGVSPIILEVYTENDKRIGYFAGGIQVFHGVKLLGSPFWGWMSQHMGFDLREEVNKAALVDNLIDYAIDNLHVNYIQLTDFKIEYADIKNCTHKLIKGMCYKTCYIDLTLDEAQLRKNLKSGYRTCIRKFYKNGGYIEEDYTEEFIEEHHRHLEQVFKKVGRKTPNYREKMCMLYNSSDFSKGADNKLGVYSIKAIIPEKVDGEIVNKSIASSYYIHNGYMAKFVSNASYPAYLKYCPNQALTWNAMMAFKAAGLHYLDMGGGGDYKLNYSGGDWQPKPVIIYCSNLFVKLLILVYERYYWRIPHRFRKLLGNMQKKRLLKKAFLC